MNDANHAASAAKKQRLDTLLVARGLAESRERARQLILAGEVVVAGKANPKPGHLTPVDAEIEVNAPLRYVSRGGLKLEKALACFELDVHNKVAIDVGASTGGFTDCLLQRGAKFVYAVDVGHGQLAWKIRQDARVCALERTNVRAVDINRFERPIHIAVVDVSFISLRKVLPVIVQILQPKGDLIALVKPQFEAGRKQVSKGGVVREAFAHVQVLQGLIQFVQELHLTVMGLTHSPIRGPAGNIEYLLWAKKGGASASEVWEERAVCVVEQAHLELTGER